MLPDQHTVPIRVKVRVSDIRATSLAIGNRNAITSLVVIVSPVQRLMKIADEVQEEFERQEPLWAGVD
jgi:hypothetical protein